jgi:molybdate transport system permease protein
VPVLALFVTASPGELARGLGHPSVGPALRVSLATTAASLAVVVGLGTPLAWTLAQSNARWARAVETALQLPVAIPPAVAGLALLLAFGRRGLVASLASPAWSLAFTGAAVVIAQVFVAAPLYVQAAGSAFRRVDPALLAVARTLGASPWRALVDVALPLAAPGLASGAITAYARALGEFGATLMFAGNLEGRTQTLPLAIYAAMDGDPRAAQAIAVALVVVALALLLGARAWARRAERAGEPRA